jgi:hypothetical protein
LENRVEVKVNHQTYSFQRPKLKRWVQLDELHSEIREATTRRDTRQISNLISDFLVVAFPSSTAEEWLSLDWELAFSTLADVITANKIRIKIPLLEADNRTNKKEEKKDPWEYQGRSWAYWANVFAKAYGWTLPQIEELEIEDALQLMQEIQLDDQFEKEWEWSQTEIAYPYDAASKKSTYKPLARPTWMRPIPEAPKLVKIRKEFLPLGNIISMSDLIPKRNVA